MRKYSQIVDCFLPNCKGECEIPLLTPDGKVLAPIQIVYDDAEIIANPSSEIKKLCGFNT